MHNEAVGTVPSNVFQFHEKTINRCETRVLSVSRDEQANERVQARPEKVGQLFT